MGHVKVSLLGVESLWGDCTFIFYFKKSNPWHKHAKWPPSDLTPWTLTICTTYLSQMNFKNSPTKSS